MTREHWLIPDSPYSSYDDYRRRTGESALEKARRLSPDAVLKEVRLSGLRGRGGAGFPTGTKWASIRNHRCPTRFVVCNAAEGEPGTFKDRWLLRHNPYAVLEGMLVAAEVVNAERLFIGIKSSFVPERERLARAIDEIGRARVLGGRIFEVVPGPDEYLFGEEKALLEVLSGGDPLPREAHYPPYEVGLFPTPSSPNPALVNNAETFAHVPSIVRAGAASFRALGTDDTPGTVIFTVSGDVRRPGVYEREAGISLRDLFHEVAGGPREGRRLKAALSGVAAAVIAEERFDAPADFASLSLIGAGLGSAGFVVLDDRASVARVAQAVARFLYVESCNQCSACKHGLRIASHALDALFDPDRASEEALERALLGARSAPQANRCYLPVQGSIAIPSLIDRYRAEFEEQVRRPSASPAPYLIPKIVDYDPTTGFQYDERQALKRPDWTYEEPFVEETRPRPAAAPLDAARAAVSVRLAPDVVAALEDRLAGIDAPLDEAVNDALREWLGRRR
jgi:NADH:ubiquinone oxidoreductase subunit F (NADH-binding)